MKHTSPTATESTVTSVPTVTIDGPGGSGKGSAASRLARALGWHYLDSGLLYRLTALAAADHGIDCDDQARLATLASDLDVQFLADCSTEKGESILLEGAPVGQSVRSEEVGNRASVIAALPAVRTALLGRQRAFAQLPGLIADGRDMGTVVFPDAALKIFLTATAEERARRRFVQLRRQGLSARLTDLLEQVTIRDRRDAERPVAPLKPAADAVVLDSTHLSLDEVVGKLLALVSEKDLIEETVRQ